MTGGVVLTTRSAERGSDRWKEDLAQISKEGKRNRHLSQGSAENSELNFQKVCSADELEMKERDFERHVHY